MCNPVSVGEKDACLVYLDRVRDKGEGELLCWDRFEFIRDGLDVHPYCGFYGFTYLRESQ